MMTDGGKALQERQVENEPRMKAERRGCAKRMVLKLKTY